MEPLKKVLKAVLNTWSAKNVHIRPLWTCPSTNFFYAQNKGCKWLSAYVFVCNQRKSIFATHMSITGMYCCQRKTYMYTSNQWVQNVNETKKCGCCNPIVLLFLSMLTFVNDLIDFRLNPPQNVLGVNYL